MQNLYWKLLFVLSIFAFQVNAQVGINTSTPLSTLDINGNLSIKTVSLVGGISGSATLINDGVYISLSPSAVAPEFYVNDPASLPGRIYILRNITNTETAILYTNGGKRFFNKASNTGTLIGAPITLPPNSTGKSIILVSDGSNWTYFD